MKDYASYSYWLETCGDDLTPRPSLPGPIQADVAIVGAGYSGLWTAYYLLRQNPSLRVVLLEREIAGFGASGRNGGWCSGGFPLTTGMLAERYGVEGARAVMLAMAETVDEVGRVTKAEGVDIQYRKGGVLRIARGPQGVPSIRAAHARSVSLGLGDRNILLTAEETETRVRVAGAVLSLWSPDCATIHPGKLVRGLARVVERMGATIYEGTEVTGFTTGVSPSLETARGLVHAGTIVLCGEAYLTRLAPLHRQLIPVYSLITLTEPLSDAQWAEIGWRGNECLASTRYTVDYLSRTVDGRILFGSRGRPYTFGSRIEDAYDRHEPTHAMIREMVHAWFPMLRGTRFTHAWGGPVGMPRDSVPTFAFDPAAGVATARGYTGQGVATTNLAGRILTGLITGSDSPVTRLPIVGHRSRNWEPEPLRWLGARYVQYSFGRIDARAERTGVPPRGNSLPERLARH
jgi:glycine/D-amino acid oxidase-like deaminating enzyme